MLPSQNKTKQKADLLAKSDSKVTTLLENASREKVLIGI